jgi:ATP-dependent RNA helicase SUPV3L1/SUV3
MPSDDPAEILDQLAQDAGLTLAAAERPALLRALGGVPPASPDALREAVFALRRRSWRRRLGELAREATALPVRPDDLEAAAASVTDPEAGTAALQEALRQAVLARLGGHGTADTALAVALEELPRPAGGAPTLDDIGHCALLVAEAFGMAAPDALAFSRRAVAAERRARAARREAAQAARETQVAEEARLREWEASLVGAEAVPALLGCTPAEAEAWIAERRLPIARQVLVRRRGRRIRVPEFDPAVLRALAPTARAWREPAPRRPGTVSAAPARPTPAHPAPLREEPRRTSHAAIARIAGLDRYAAHFATARALDRRILACLGPTNSGKTHFGLSRLAAAESGVALGPLRLLAHEYREALEAQGVPTALSTGEERIERPGSRHTAATVEMCPFRTPVDVAVVDEAQMLADPDRGPAWTAAIMGVPARTVIVLGAPDAAPMLRRIAELCGDPLEEMRLERMGPLTAARTPVPLAEIGRGDALIAFSRREVFALRAELLRRGRSVAVVYGALGPTVRRAEARRFRDGEAEVLVATDAIGMGLNIGPLRRVVFSALSKWDGKQDRPLTVQEIKQIGGRAGRFGGAHAEGVVAVLAGGGDPALIARALEAGATPPVDLRPPVAPDADIVAAVAAEIGTQSLFGTLRRIERSVLRRDDPNYRLGDLSTQIEIAAVVDGVRELPLLDRWTYALCPVDVRDEGVARLSDWAVAQGMGLAVAPPLAGRLPPPDRAGQDALQLAERVHRRLVAWRWMAMRFPQTFRDLDGALAESRRLNEWIEAVLSAQPSDRVRAVAGGGEMPRPKVKGRGGRGR